MAKPKKVAHLFNNMFSQSKKKRATSHADLVNPDAQMAPEGNKRALEALDDMLEEPLVSKPSKGDDLEMIGR